MILFIAGGGGFAWESKQLIERLLSDDNKLLVTYPKTSFEFREFYESLNCVKYPPVTHRSGYKFKYLLNFISVLISGIKIMFGNNVDSVVCIGNSAAIPFFMVAKLFGKKRIYIESITRTVAVSNTAKTLLKWRLVDKVYVQWPKMQELPNKIYKGNLL